MPTASTADVKSISAIPVSSGKFEIEFELPQDKIPDWVVAGMSCKIQVKSYDKQGSAHSTQSRGPRRRGRPQPEIRVDRQPR